MDVVALFNARLKITEHILKMSWMFFAIAPARSRSDRNVFSGGQMTGLLRKYSVMPACPLALLEISLGLPGDCTDQAEKWRAVNGYKTAGVGYN